MVQRRYFLMFYFLFLGVFFFGVVPSQAGVISIETRITTEVRRDTLHTTITVTNRGDEAANNIQMATQSPKANKSSNVLPSLLVGKSHSESFDYPLQGLAPGRYPLLAQIGYTDANVYPFSALAVSLFSYRQDATSLILGILGNTQIQKSGRLNLSVKNMDAQDKTLQIQLITPREISVEGSKLQVHVTAGSESKFSFHIRNFSAIQNSTYAVYAVIEYEEGGMHHAALAPGTIVILPPGLMHTIQQGLPYILTALAVIFVLIFGRIYWERKNKAAVSRK